MLWKGVLVAVAYAGFTAATLFAQTAPEITSSPVTEATVGEVYTYNVEANGSPEPTFTLGNGPDGMSIDAASGVISWTPTLAGNYDVSLTASNTEGIDTQGFTIIVTDKPVAPTITSTPVTSAMVSQDYSYDVAATGTPAPTFSLSESPVGMQIDAVSGLVSWTPLATGEFNVTVVATNEAGEDTQSFSVTVTAQLTVPVITTSPITQSTVGQSYRYDVNATGNPVPTYSLAESPLGMTISSSSGVVRWTPALPGEFNVSVVASNSQGTDTQSFTINVSGLLSGPSITSSPKTTATVNEIYTYDVEASGNPAASFSLVEAPAGMTIGQESGLITWIPATADTFSVIVEAANDLGTDTQEYSITVSEQLIAPAIVSVPVSQTFRNQNYSYTVEAEGNPAPTFRLLIAPIGMEIDATTGEISWIPANTGAFEVSVEASNSQGNDVQEYTLTVTMNLVAPTITSSPVTQALAGVDYLYDVQAVGNPAPTFSLAESPAGMEIETETGVIDWLPEAPGSYSVAVEARNSQGSFTQRFTVLVGLLGSVPLVQLQSLEVISSTSLNLTASVNPNGSPTTVTFEYGEGDVTTFSVSALPEITDGFTEISVKALVSSLEEGKTYLYRAIAENSIGRIIGSTKSFTTYKSTYQVSEERTFTGSIDSLGYRLFSVPGDVDIDAGDTVTGVQHEDWGIFLENGKTANYYEPYDGSDKFHFKAGRGFWILAKSNWVVPEQIVDTVPLDRNGDFKISLQEGWNIIASPYDVSLPWEYVRAATPSVSSTAKLWTYNGAFREAFSFEPYQAYYYFNDAGDGAQLTMPFPGIWQNILSLSASKSDISPPAIRRLVIEAIGRDDLVSMAEIRVDEYASTDKDHLDQYAPRDGFSALSLRIRPSFEAPYGLLALDARASVTSGAEFDLVLNAPAMEMVELRTSGLEYFQDQNVVLVDRVTGQFMDLHDRPTLTIHPVQDRMRYRLLIGSDEFVENQREELAPRVFTLQQNYPNPFSGSTTVSFSLPEPGYVDITVYDILGREVGKLAGGMREAGFHEVVWDGETGRGAQLPDGVYLLRLKTDEGPAQVITMTRVH